MLELHTRSCFYGFSLCFVHVCSRGGSPFSFLSNIPTNNRLLIFLYLIIRQILEINELGCWWWHSIFLHISTPVPAFIDKWILMYDIIWWWYIVYSCFFPPFSLPFHLEVDAQFAGPEAQCFVALCLSVDSAVTLSFHLSFKLIRWE